MNRLPIRWLALGVVVLVVVATLALVVHGGTRKLTLTADFARTSGLYQANDVTVLGVPVGRVTSIQPDGPIVHVTLQVDGDVPIPRNARAVIMQRSLVTDRYVELTPAYDDGTRLADGAHIPLSRTVSPIGADDVLAAVNRLLGAFDQAGSNGLRGLLHAGAQNFRGNGAIVGRIIVGVRRLARVGAASTGDLNTIITGLDQLTVALTRRDRLVNRFSTDLTVATVQFARDRGTFASTVRELGTSLRFLTSFLVRNQAALGGDVTRIAALTALMKRHEAQLARSLRVLPQALITTGSATNSRGQLYVNFNASEFFKNNTLLDAFCSAATKILCAKLAPRASPSRPIALSLRSLLGGAR